LSATEKENNSKPIIFS